MMTEREFIRKEIENIEITCLAMDGSIPTWSDEEFAILVENLKKRYNEDKKKEIKC